MGDYLHCWSWGKTLLELDERILKHVAMEISAKEDPGKMQSCGRNSMRALVIFHWPFFSLNM